MKIPWGKPYFWENERKYLIDAYDSTWISGGYYVEELEKRFARLHGYKYGLVVANGTCSIFLSLKALDIGPGDEVLLPGFAFIAALNMVLEVGATPILCDIDPQTMLIDPVDVKLKITNKTKAILPVHTYGNVCDMSELRKIADDHNLYILEDVAEAIFSKYKNRYAGTYSEISSYSFQTTKTITTGEGGMVLTNSSELYEKMRKLRSHGMGTKKYWHEGVAYNFRLTNLQAAIGLAQFENLDKIVAERDRLFKLYRLKSSTFDSFTLQLYKPEVSPVVWAFPIVLKNSSKINRDELMILLEEKGIEVRPGFYTAHQLPAYGGPLLQNSEFISKNTISLPFYVGITDHEVDYIFETLKSLL